jgi:hypothetical protein
MRGKAPLPFASVHTEEYAMHRSKKRLALLAAAVAVVLAPLDVPAQALQNTNISSAAGNCVVTDSSYAPNFKVKALSSDNVGPGNIFVICALQSDRLAAGIDHFRIALRSTNPGPVTINCTGVAGTASTPAVYLPKGALVFPGQESVIEWTFNDNGGVLLPHPASVTCLLPPNTGVTTDEVSYVIQLF